MMKKFFLFLLLSFSLSLYGQESDTNGGYFFKKGEECYNAGDYENAFYYWEKAAKKGDDAAMNNIGIMYKNGVGVDINFKKAFDWLKRPRNIITQVPLII